jgi:hypothetical protein
MENSPPGIQTIPDGPLAGGLALFGTVGKKCDPPPAAGSVLDIGRGEDTVDDDALEEGPIEGGPGAAEAACVWDSLTTATPATARAIAIATAFRSALVS